jgi:hypothetical protein
MSSKKADSITKDKRWIWYVVFVAIVAWLALWGIIQLTVSSMTKLLFFVLLFFAVASTFMPAIAYLNARFGRFSDVRVYRVRFVRQSLQIGLFVIVIAWLQMQRVLSLTLALILVGVLILTEMFLITREPPVKKA